MDNGILSYWLPPSKLDENTAMKIYIGNYKDHWISPYTMLEKALWWKDWDKIDYDTPWVERWADRLEPISRAIQWIGRRVNPRCQMIKIDSWDTWNMYGTLAQITLPMLKQLNECKHGAPFVDDEDVPEDIRSSNTRTVTEDYEVDEFHFQRWDWAMQEMIWAFEQLQPDYDWEQQYITGELKHTWGPKDDSGCREMILDRSNYHVDELGIQQHQQRINNGLRLFAKYYQSLWD